MKTAFELIRKAWKTERKELILNTLFTTALMAFGIFICYLHFIKWIPFENYATSSIALIFDLMWAYTGCFIGIVMFTTSLLSNFVINVFSSSFFDKILG